MPNQSAFALPERLAAKARPELIADDDSHLARIADALTGSITRLTERLADLRRMPARHGRAVLERDLDIHHTTSRLSTLRRHGLDLCLGHIVAEDESAPLYIGRLALSDESGEPLLVDWRSAAAEPFFGATHGNPMGVARRRRYRWAAGRVSDYWDEVFTDAEFSGHQVALDDQSAFIASLGSARTFAMRDVLGTIAADQDAIIRASSRGTLVVDGGPGTGKTVVALHRSAYLLYADPRLGTGRGGVLFVGPHTNYLSYVADVLPSLGEDGVATCLLTDFLPEGAQATTEADAAVAALKEQRTLVDAIEAAVTFYEEAPADGLEVTTGWADFWVSPHDWADALATPAPGTPHNEARETIWEELLTILLDKVEDEDAPRDLIRRALEADRELLSTLNRAWPLIEADDLVRDLWSVPAYLRHCAPSLSDAQIRLLQRPVEAPWTTADLPILDAARRRLGDPDAAARRIRAARITAAEQARVATVIDDLIAADDGEGLVTMLRHPDLRSNLIDEATLERPTPDALAGPFAHIVVDEAQELTDAQWQMLIGRCPSRSFTIVGDRAQARAGFTESWPERLRQVGLGHVEVKSLTINYRTPAEVMAVAEPTIRAVLPQANVPTSVRHSGIPVRHGSPAELDHIVTSWLAEHDEGTVAIIGDSTFAHDRVSVLTPITAKGLEFDLVILIEPASFGAGIAGAVDRYVSMTRATGSLVILTTS